MVIDELFVVLGIDTTKFNHDQREALDGFRRTKQGAEEFTKNMEQQGQKLGDVFSIVRRGALGIVGAFVGGEVAGFLGQIAGMDAATGRFAKTINTTVTNLSTWQNMIRSIGGDSAGATSVLGTLQQTIESVRQGSGMFDGGFATLMNRSGATVRDDADAVLRKIRGHIAGEMEGGRMNGAEAATWLRRIPGMNQDMVNLLSMTTKEFEALAKAAHAAGVATDGSAKAGEKLQAAFTAITLKIEDLMRAITPFMTLLTKPLGDIGKDDINKVMGDQPLMTFTPGSPMERLHNFLWRGNDKKLESWWRGDGKKPDAGSGGPDADNNNPGAIKFGKFAQSFGATGSDGRLAVFPNKAAGEAAMAQLLLANYQGMTLEQIQKRWSTNHNSGADIGAMSSATGLGPGDKPDLNDPDVRSKLMRGILDRGGGVGAKSAARERMSDAGRGAGGGNTTEVYIDKLSVNAPNAKDADGIAQETAPALKRAIMGAQINTGLA